MKALLRKGFGLGGRFDRSQVVAPGPTFSEGSDEYWMEQALLASMESIGITSPNPAVGCILVQEGHEIARGSTQAYQKEHAERMAFLNLPVGADLSRVTAYVTLEPCTHQGFQPPCVDLLLQSPIPRVVIAVADPDPRVNGEGIERLKKAGKEVVLSILGPELSAWHAPFLYQRRTGNVFWAAKWAETKTGHLADADFNSKWITGPESRAYTHWLRQKYDAIVVGARTFLSDEPALTVRECALPHHRDPIRFVFDPKGRLLDLPESKVGGFRILVLDSVLAAKGIEPGEYRIPVRAELASPDLWIQFKSTLESLPWNRPLQSVMVEGGPSLLREMFKPDLFNGVHRFVGSRTFSNLSDRQKLEWSPGEKWKLLAEQEFKQDHLQEWIKED